MRRTAALVVACVLAVFAVRVAAADDADLEAFDAALEAEGDDFARAAVLERSVFDAEDLDPTIAVERCTRAALLFERVGDLEAGRGPGYWRASRSTWLAGELLPLDDEAGRIARFERALVLAERGLVANPDCAECMLWKFTAMGRLRTTRGLFEGYRQVPDMAKLLDRAIELQPTSRDNEDNSTLGNLHYSSAIFYRLVPDWFWIRWVIGVKGDKPRALEHARTALAMHPNRLDFQIEVGTQLLCLGSDRGDDDKIEQGKQALRVALEREPHNEDERREQAFARIMLDEPERACGYTGDKLVEIDQQTARGATR